MLSVVAEVEALGLLCGCLLPRDRSSRLRIKTAWLVLGVGVEGLGLRLWGSGIWDVRHYETFGV